MCGIAGFVGRPDRKRAEFMRDIIRHRGPDGEGIFETEACTFVHTRLSVLDLSHAAHQPMVDEGTGVVLTYNGEIYNFAVVKAELLAMGYGFTSSGDTEVVLKAYLAWGESFVHKLDGMFAIALWDGRDQTLRLFRDRFGKKPLFYSFQDGELCFASELKALLGQGGCQVAIDETAYFTYLSLQYSLNNQCIIKGIHKLPPATSLTLKKGGQPVVRPYWSLGQHPVPALDQVSTQEAMLTLFKRAVEKRMVSDVPVGVLLSGGVDSSAVACVMAELSSKPVKTFTAGFGAKDDEYGFAQTVVTKINSDHTELKISLDDVLGNFEKIAWHLDEPIADGGGIATYFVARELKKHISVVLVGEGGDELFGGYSWHHFGVGKWKLLPEALRQHLYFYVNSFASRSVFSKVQSALWHTFAEERELTKNSFFAKMTNFERRQLLPNSLLMKVDRNTMAFGVEARVPFLDEDLFRYVIDLPVRDRIGKNLFKQSLSGLVPPAVLTRKKQGFRMPFQNWYDGELMDYSRALIMGQDAFARTVFEEKELARLFEKPKHVFQRHNRHAMLWRLTLFEVWYKAISSLR